MIKNKLWLVQLPFIALATVGYLVAEEANDGRLENAFLREKVAPNLSWVRNQFTDWKFKLRGAQPPTAKIVIVEVDSPTIDAVGRWPWHRDAMAMLIDKTFEAGAKVVGLDMVFSEPDPRVPEGLAEFLKGKELGGIAAQFETDPQLMQVVAKHREKLVLGWSSESVCSPLYSKPEECPVTLPEAVATHPKDFAKFAYAKHDLGARFDPTRTPVSSVVTILANVADFDAVASHSGYFNAYPDSDAFIRRSHLVMFANGKPYPSLPLEMARVGLGEDLSIQMDGAHRVRRIGFAKSGREIPVNPLGVMEVNFRGGKSTYKYISALDVLRDGDVIKDELNRKLAGLSKAELLKDAYVLIGVTALGVFDMRSFPFDANIPGVDGHAHILDTILADDALLPASRGGVGGNIMLILLVVGALAFGFVAQKLEAVPALILFTVVFAGFGLVDLQVLFRHNLNWNTGFFYIEVFTVFVLTMAAKYVMEERNKKFIRSAFTKYVAPAVVDSILKDPTKLSLGGERREVTILFSDIRGFTTFSEKMDAKALSGFLNDYLTIMTNIVFSTEGTLDKYIGDAVMAFWGAPLDQPKHGHNACGAAIKMMRALDENYDRFKTQYGIDVKIGIGLNTGAVSVGNMGSTTNFEYTVIGDHVNLASRLEGLTKAYRVGIVTTRFALDDIEKNGDKPPLHRVLDLVKVKGKTQAIELIQLFHQDIVNQEGLKMFEEGRLHYAKQEWDLAIEKFEKSATLLATRPDERDGPSEIMIERCRDFKKEPPEAGWKGDWTMHEK
jgi:adenylate cyclase